jgi:hypothetical protein
MDDAAPGPAAGSEPSADLIKVIADAELRGHGELNVGQTRFERCYVHNSRARGGRAVAVEAIDCTTWSCHLYDVRLEDCVVRNLKTSPGGGGRATPLFLWGGSARRVTVAGTVGGIIWNPPTRGLLGFDLDPAKVEEVRRYYDSIDDWAVDVSQARFRSMPSLRFGPPGRLVRRDPETQPLITKQAAARALELIGSELGIWRAVLADLVTGSWPDEIVLMPALGARKARREEELRGLERLRQIGAFEDDRQPPSRDEFSADLLPNRRTD